MNWYSHQESWLFILRRYLPRLAICSLAWEVVQTPLYTLWSEPRLGWILFAIAHCTVGDIMIGTVALLAALFLSRADEFANWRKNRIAMLMIFLAITYTLLSEHINLAQGSWAYSSWMPVLPWIDVGLAPVMQWIIVPLVAWRWVSRL